MAVMRSPEKLNPLGEKILDAIRSKPGEWLTRNDVAALIGRQALTPYDFKTLDYLAQQGLIEARQNVIGVVRSRWEYRVSE